MGTSQVNSDTSTYNIVYYGAVKKNGVDLQVLLVKDFSKVYEMKQQGVEHCKQFNLTENVYTGICVGIF